MDRPIPIPLLFVCRTLRRAGPHLEDQNHSTVLHARRTRLSSSCSVLINNWPWTIVDIAHRIGRVQRGQDDLLKLDTIPDAGGRSSASSVRKITRFLLQVAQ